MTSRDVIDQDGQPQVWKAHYWRYHVERWESCDSPEDAVGFLRAGEEDGELLSVGVVWPDGTERAYDWVNDALGTAMLGNVKP